MTGVFGVFSVAHDPGGEGEAVIRYYADSPQEVIRMFWHHFWRSLMLSIFVYYPMGTLFWNTFFSYYWEKYIDCKNENIE